MCANTFPLLVSYHLKKLLAKDHTSLGSDAWTTLTFLRSLCSLVLGLVHQLQHRIYLRDIGLTHHSL